MFIYTGNHTESHRNTQKSIYSSKHTQNTKTHYIFFETRKTRKHTKNTKIHFKSPYLQKRKVRKNQSFMFIFIALFKFYVEGHTA